MENDPANAPLEPIDADKAVTELNTLLTKIDEGAAKLREGEAPLPSPPDASGADKSA